MVVTLEDAHFSVISSSKECHFQFDIVCDIKTECYKSHEWVVPYEITQFLDMFPLQVLDLLVNFSVGLDTNFMENCQFL